MKIFLISLFLSTNSLAQWDASVAGSLRSYPLGASIDLDFGYTVVTWGEASDSSPWFGYLRPAFNLSTIGVFHSGAAELEFFPLAFLGFSTGAARYRSSAEFSNYDCTVMTCEGLYNSTFSKAHLVVGTSLVFLYVQWKRELFTHENKSLAFVEPNTGLLLSADSDVTTRWMGVLGVNLNDIWGVQALSLSTTSDENAQMSLFSALAVQYKREALSVLVGAGEYESNLLEREGFGFLRVKWELAPTAGLL